MPLRLATNSKLVPNSSVLRYVFRYRVKCARVPTYCRIAVRLTKPRAGVKSAPICLNRKSPDQGSLGKLRETAEESSLPAALETLLKYNMSACRTLLRKRLEVRYWKSAPPTVLSVSPVGSPLVK